MKTNKLKIVSISDTHNRHEDLNEFFDRERDIDILIHSGDGSNEQFPSLNNNELRKFLMWMSSLEGIKYKIYVPGNHDTSIFNGYIKEEDFPEIIFLINERINILGYNFYGSPITPTFGYGWAYNVDAGKDIERVWDSIPSDTEILITHGPPLGVLDLTSPRKNNSFLEVGCPSLLSRVKEVKPLLHFFGHIHDENGAYNNGKKLVDGTLFINSSVVDVYNRYKNEPLVITLDSKV